MNNYLVQRIYLIKQNHVELSAKNNYKNHHIIFIRVLRCFFIKSNDIDMHAVINMKKVHTCMFEYVCYINIYLAP